MSVTTKVFYDGMESVKLSDGVVHMEFFNLIAGENGGRKTLAGEIVLSQQAFLRAYAVMEDLVRQLEKAGLIKRKSQEAGKTAAGSPNFQ